MAGSNAAWRTDSNPTPTLTLSTNTMSTHADPTIYDCIELPDSEKGDECQLWTGDEPTPCEQPTAYVFVHEASTTRDDDKRRNVVACEDCAPAPDEYRSESNPAGGAAER